MRTITKTIIVFSFDELSEEAKQKAIESFRRNTDHQWLLDDSGESLNKFCDTFNIAWHQFDPCEMYRSQWQVNAEDTTLELSGVRLRTWLLNNHYKTLYQRKPYGKYEKREHDEWRYDRYSKIQYTETDCPFTGMCYDEDILQPIRDFIKCPKPHITYEELMNDCMYSLGMSVCSEIEYLESDEGITEDIQANDYEFTSDGRIYHG